MSELVSVKLHTVPSDLVYSGDKRMDEPYRRVVGMEYGEGMATELWSLTDQFRGEGDYDRSATAVEGLEMPHTYAMKLLSFFERYFTANRAAIPSVDKAGHQIGEQTEPYNCHRFGYWMRGSLVATQFEVPEAPDFVTEGFAVRGGVAMGRHSVLGVPGAAIHSVVGLGRDNDECLQVLSTSGFMGIDTYEHVRKYYDPDGSRGLEFYV